MNCKSNLIFESKGAIKRLRELELKKLNQSKEAKNLLLKMQHVQEELKDTKSQRIYY